AMRSAAQTRDRALVDGVHPLEIRLGPGPRNDLDLSAPHRFDGRFGERLHPYVPLLGDERLDDGLAAIADADGVAIGLDPLDEAERPHVLHDAATALEAIEARVLPRQRRHLPVEADHAARRPVVAASDLPPPP